MKTVTTIYVACFILAAVVSFGYVGPEGASQATVDPGTDSIGYRGVVDSPFSGKAGLIALSALSYQAGEGEIKAIVVFRSSGTNGDVGVPFSCISDSAISGSDFIPCGGWLSWSDGEAGAKVIVVDIVDDAIAEGEETFHVTLGEASGGASTLKEQSSARVDIVDNDHAAAGGFQFSLESYSMTEGTGPVAIRVIRVGGSSGAVSVTCVSNAGSAVAGSDFIPISAELQWSDGDQSPRIVVVEVIDDGMAESEEWLGLTLWGPTGGAVLGSPNTATLTITDNDYAPAGSLRLVLDSTHLIEGQGMAVAVSRVGGEDGAITVDYAAIAGTAAEGVDFVPSSGTLRWEQGDRRNRSFRLQALDDGVFDGEEHFRVLLTNATGGAVIGTPSNVSMTIENINPGPPGTFEFSTSNYRVDEGGSAAILVRRLGGSVGAVSVRCSTASSGAISGLDYSAVNEILSWADGEAGYRVVVVETFDDANTEGDEVVNLSLDSPSGGAVLGSPNLSALIIDDNDCEGAGSLEFTVARISLEEGKSTVVKVNRTGGSICSVDVNYSTSPGSATAGSDYVSSSGALSWQHGEAGVKTLVITAINDSMTEGNETFFVNLDEPTGGASLGSPSVGVLIVDN